MHLTSYLFEHENFDYFAIEKLALDYIEKAFMMAPNNLFIKKLFIKTRYIPENISSFYLLYTEIFKNKFSIKSMLIGIMIAWFIYHFVNI